MINKDEIAREALNRIKKADPQLYQNLTSLMGGKPAMGNLGGLWESFTSAVTTIGNAADIYVDKKTAIDQQKLAQATALDVIRARERQVELARIETQRMDSLTRQLEAEAELQRSQNQLQQMIADVELSGMQQKGLLVAGGLTALLIFMVAKRKGAI